MSDLNSLYPDLIKAHNASPFHFEARAGAPVQFKAYNPVCGDSFELFLDNTQNRINDLHFYGFGCAISKASTSVMVKELSGKSLREALDTCNLFLDFIEQKPQGVRVELPENFKAFSGVHQYPERYDCATLSWKAMKKYLESKEETK